ncbi:hypothetical protein KsCSTR_47200 [Candidatus Kuenenia stuttgartiensis]|uniref:Uncharacterized protein n=1 Tax=Kuenenia stuttgartiensis TaxID=174633 RepID=A0A6G7GY13_KUEST|nr:hypothetical protein [Candidatus Kuenenia stuttgartiensis]QII14097.1 hypothetical protein KsCSTR_47200 [Candidatus Kuenenia stuttgartiensis]
MLRTVGIISYFLKKIQAGCYLDNHRAIIVPMSVIQKPKSHLSISIFAAPILSIKSSLEF